MNDSSPTIVDSAMSREAALAQNPASPAPKEIVEALRVVPVEYYGFDGAVHAGQIVVEHTIAHEVEAFFKNAFEMRFPIERVVPISSGKYAWDDEVSCGDNNSSGYNYRFVPGTSRLSKHARGRAFDINPVQNIYIRYGSDMREVFRSPKDAPYDEAAKGTLTAGHPLVLLMKSFGWVWGGDWTPESGRVDYQHFEKE